MRELHSGLGTGVTGLAALIVVGCLSSAAPAVGHHAIAAIYDSSRRQTIEGIVTEFHFVNPHPFLVLNVKDAAGQSEQWRLEMDNRFELADIGVTRDTFKPGDQLLIVGSPARRQPRSLYVRRLDRPSDGFWYEQAGPSPRIRSGDRP